MYEDYDAVFMILDKIMELVEKIYTYYGKKDENIVNIELGNLYTIKEEEEEESCFKNDFILEEFILV